MTYRTPRARVSGLGSAGQGTHHWWLQRISALALIPLTVLFIVPFAGALGGEHDAVLALYAHPFHALVAVLFIAVAFRHLALGLIESLGGSAENLAEIDAPFLQGLDMPAALVEVAFLSNELELAIVREEEDSICERIVGALEAFLAGREGEE